MPSASYLFNFPITPGFVFFLSIFLAGIFFVCFCFFVYAYWQLRIEQQNEALILQYQKLQSQYYGWLLSTGKNMRILRHDLNNHLQTLQHLLSEHEPHASEYLSQIEHLLTADNSTEHPSPIHFVLQEYQEKAAQADCSLEIQLPPTDQNPDPLLIGLLPAVFSMILQQVHPGTQIFFTCTTTHLDRFTFRYVKRYRVFPYRAELLSVGAFAAKYGYDLQVIQDHQTVQLVLSPVPSPSCSDYLTTHSYF